MHQWNKAMALVDGNNKDKCVQLCEAFCCSGSCLCYLTLPCLIIKPDGFDFKNYFYSILCPDSALRLLTGTSCEITF